MKTIYDDNNTLLLGKKWNNGDYDLFLAIQITDMEDAGCEGSAKYVVEVLAASPEAAGAENVATALQCNASPEDIPNATEEDKAVALIEYGISAMVWTKSGNNRRELIRAARKELPMIQGLFGFYMDRCMNAIGDTGWDWIAGDIGAALRRFRENEKAAKAGS